MTPLALSKTLDPADFDQLTEELAIVDQHFTRDREQHPMRRWEYAMALRACTTWYDVTAKRPQGPVIDVGGAGSPFWRMVNPYACTVIDPDGGVDLAEHLRLGGALASEVYCLSVLEHVEDLDRFLYHLSCLVAPGGLLFLTMDYREQEGPDTAHFHWMRKRIFAPSSYLGLVGDFPDAHGFLDRDFQLLGGMDGRQPLIYHGPQVYDYTFASLALVKRP